MITKNYPESVKLANLARAREASLRTRAKKRTEYLNGLRNNNKYLYWLLENRRIAKIGLVTLYMAEGAKRRRSSLAFGNSDPNIIGLFLHLLRLCYKIDEDKFRCTVQCRADQNVPLLQEFWYKITKIPIKQFSKAQIDKRSIGKPTLKVDYKGVCRIGYFSADVFNDLIQASSVLGMGH